MAFPKLVDSGEPMVTSWANSVVQSLRKTRVISGRTVNSGGNVTVYQPFDPIYMERGTGATWVLKVQAAYLFTSNTLSGSPILYDTHYLTEYPEITVIGASDLFYNYETNKLQWDTPSSVGNLCVLKFDYTAGGGLFEAVNLHPHHIDLRDKPPFTPLLSRSGPNSTVYKVKLLGGDIIEHTYSYTGQGITHTVPATSTWNAITDGQQVSIKINTNTYGVIQSTSMEVETLDTRSISHRPPCAGNAGRDGEYHIKMAVFHAATGLELFGCGSNIDFYRDIPLLDNLSNPAVSATPNQARVLKELDTGDAKYTFRDIKPSPYSQLLVDEQANSVVISGNLSAGSIGIEMNGVAADLYISGVKQAEQTITWADGLVTRNGTYTWKLSSASLSADSVSSYAPDGSTFRLDIWTGSVTTGAAPSYHSFTGLSSTSMYFLSGLAYLTEPAGFPDVPTVKQTVWITPFVEP